MDDTVRGVSCYLFRCEALESEPHFLRSAIRLLKELDVTYFQALPYPHPIDPCPEAKLEPNGDLISIILASHPLLQPGNNDWNYGEYFISRFGSAVWERSLRFDSQYIRHDVPHFAEALQDMALGRREFLKLLIPHVKPRLALADDVWNKGGVKEVHVETADLRRLFWVTYFGPAYVEKHGLNFLMNIPAWKVEELDGGVLLTVTERFLDFAEHDPKETLQYLKQKFKTIRPNRFKIPASF